MKRFWYRMGVKSANVILQGLLVCVLVVCLTNVFYWTEGSFSISEMGKSFEETKLFLSLTERTVRSKIAYQENKELFERDGQYEELKEVDIRQYASGTQDETNLNLNTAYYIRDLLTFHENGENALRNRIEDLLNSGMTEQAAGEELKSEAQTLETVLPISGSRLADYSELSANPGTALLEYYQYLCETSRDVASRYQAYLTAQEDPQGLYNNEAPSNVQYYVENTSTRQRYTNMGVKSYSAAQRMVQNDEELEFLYVGERKFNIMAANSEYVMNEEASRWFIDTNFLGSGERVLLAVNVSYPIGDEIQEAYLAYEQREPVLLVSIVGAAGSGILLVLLLALLTAAAGRQEKGGAALLSGFDRIPTEIAAGLCLIVGVSWYLLVTEVAAGYLFRLLSFRGQLLLTAVTEYGVILFGFLSFVRRHKAGTLWSNSVCYAVLLGCRQAYSARKNSQRLVIGYVAFFALNIFFVGFFGLPGAVMALVLDMAVLLYLMRDEVGKQNVREGLYQISQGKLDYRIDTKAMTGESLEMSLAVNEMGEGLQKAVDSMVKNERLKAELITNVSHDIKTPLTSIINYVDLLKREELQNERAREYIRVLDQKSQRLKQLTEDLIEASKISSGNIELHMTELNLGQMLRQAYGECSERLEESRLEMEISMEKEPVVIRADGRQLWRVFENLFGNMAKYAMPGTKARLEMKRGQEGVEILFRNVCRQKLQMSADELQERFVRGDLSRSTEGTGLGLSIAKSLTELMGGRFQISLEDDSFQAALWFPYI
ncbi:MAG TPA: hypothetical protein IAC80_06880 [Candidatus Merdiplasma excrementigallinarum]|uniref:histidine kinase n=1 Tax=Candidatus Merdiplasma excrementigallinarum TaxID=2840864 RepID=A0A9D1P134_9FIRM|nr:hypothetical protein [Candidatus Merdiplasma excrementigallinarum]